ncbi:dihydropteridine reductase [Pelomyxa schiedti]|nr:dihydropteridine reductase [Pelomyxa schiedti]
MSGVPQTTAPSPSPSPSPSPFVPASPSPLSTSASTSTSSSPSSTAPPPSSSGTTTTPAVTGSSSSGTSSLSRAAPTVLVYGGNGALGQAVVAKFKSRGWKTVTADFIVNENADLPLAVKGSSEEDAKYIVAQLKERRIELRAIVCVAGGYAAGNVKEDIFKTLDKMWKLNVQSAIAVAYIASQVLVPAGLLVFTGANAVFAPSANALAYGMTKAATHHLISALANSSADESGIPRLAVVIGILPVMLNTPLNRKSMPTANVDNWTPLEDLAGKLLDWAEGVSLPITGSLVQVITKDRVTEYRTLDLTSFYEAAKPPVPQAPSSL